MGYPWPMDILTRDAGDRRVLINKPNEITPRSNMKRDPEDGMLKIVDPDKIKICNCTVYPEIKEQGHFHYICRDFGGNYHIYGRRQNVNGTYTDLYDELDQLVLPHLPHETVIGGELIWPGHPDSEVPTAIKSFGNELVFKAFSIPIHKGALLHNASYEMSTGLLNQYFHPEMQVYRGTPIKLGSKRDTAIVLQNLLVEAKKKKIEGWVLKQYGNLGWWKIKGLREADVFITGCKVSKSDTQYGLITSVTIGCMGPDGVIDMGSVTGFDLYEKGKMTTAYRQKKRFGNQFETEYHGRVLRVVYQEIAGKGKLKHGVFDGWRDDKIDRDCMMEQFA